MRLSILTALSLAGAPLLAQPATRRGPDATMARAAAAYAKVRTVRASFEQTLTNPLSGSVVTQTGELLQQQRPSRLSVRFTSPAGDRVVADGQAVWLYTPSTAPGQVIKVPQGQATGGIDAASELLRANSANYAAADAGTAVVTGRATHAVALTPKKPTMFTKAVIWVDDADSMVRQFEVTEPTGLVRRVRLMNVVVNRSASASEFTFTPPANVKVYDQTKAAGTR